MGQFFDLLRKDLDGNLEDRYKLRLWADTDLEFREAFVQACREDILFFFASCVFLHEPRPMRDAEGRVLPDIVPFVPWPHQIPIISALREHLGFEDVGVEKARSEGMSWIAMMTALHDWLFAIPGTQLVSVGVVSRTMDAADNPEDTGSLGWKLNFAIEHLPYWMVGELDVDWKRSIVGHTFRNLRNGSTITFYAATGEVASGSRTKYFILDELSKFPPGKDKDAMTSVQQVTTSRLIIGTPYGSEGAYYDVMHKPSSMIKLILDWKDNPTRNRGLYRMVRNVPVAVDPVNNPLAAEYSPPSEKIQQLFAQLRKNGFKLDKGERSPWYDHECDRAQANPYNIAQELDRDYGGSAYKIFTEDFFQQAQPNVRQPFCKVAVTCDEEQKPLVSLAADGLLNLWMTLDVKNRPPQHSYVVGVDICTGLGGTYSSNSVIEIIDIVTMEQVGEWAANTVQPAELADLSVALCHWLGDAYLSWERNGPGAYFTTRVKDIGYPNVYMRTKVFERRRKKAKEPGWWTEPKTKEVMFGELKRIVTVGELKLHSDPLVKECHQYLRVGRAIEHESNARSSEGPDKGEGHGDRVMAMGVAVQALQDRPVIIRGTGSAGAIQPGSIEERDRAYYGSLGQDTDDWDDRTNQDLMAGRGGRSFR